MHGNNSFKQVKVDPLHDAVWKMFWEQLYIYFAWLNLVGLWEERELDTQFTRTYSKNSILMRMTCCQKMVSFIVFGNLFVFIGNLPFCLSQSEYFFRNIATRKGIRRFLYDAVWQMFWEQLYILHDSVWSDFERKGSIFWEENRGRSIFWIFFQKYFL